MGGQPIYVHVEGIRRRRRRPFPRRRRNPFRSEAVNATSRAPPFCEWLWRVMHRCDACLILMLLLDPTILVKVQSVDLMLSLSDRLTLPDCVVPGHDSPSCFKSRCVGRPERVSVDRARIEVRLRAATLLAGSSRSANLDDGHTFPGGAKTKLNARSTRRRPVGKLVADSIASSITSAHVRRRT